MPRRRPDHMLGEFERVMNDRTAEDTYEQLRLSLIRDGQDPNAPDKTVDGAGCEIPQWDRARAARMSNEDNEVVRQVALQRTDRLKQIRSAVAQRKEMSAFDIMVAEANTYFSESALVPAKAAAAKKTSAALHRNFNATLDEADAECSQTEVIDRMMGTPPYIRGKLRPYQEEGVNWLLGLYHKKINGILADEMGLGKTFQSIAMLAYLKYSLGVPGPHIVICPKSVMGNWQREFRRWCPGLKVYKFHGSSEDRRALVNFHLQPPIRYDVIVTTYEMVLKEKGAFNKIHWRYMIVDEAHKLKNDESSASVGLRMLKTNYRLLITGTPLQNNLKELWALLNFLAPELYRDSKSFEGWFDTTTGEQDDAAVSRIHLLLQPLMLRRLKADVTTDIPAKKEIYVACKLAKKQRDWYLSVLARDADALNKASTGPRERLANIVMQLRKAANHPYLFPGAEKGPPFKTDESLVTDSGKMLLMDKILKKLRSDVPAKHKVLIFSQFTRTLDIIEDYLIYRDWGYARIDGNTDGESRDAQMAEFNNMTNMDKWVFLLSTRAGGLGINLQAANNVIIFDSDWNPQSDLQAQDRAHRIGQTRTVRVYRMITQGTVEERIYQRALKKLYLDAAVVQQGRVMQKSGAAASKEELLSYVRFGAEEMFQARGEGCDYTDEEVDALLEQGASKLQELHASEKKHQQQSLANFQLGIDETNLYDFEGVNYRNNAISRMLHLTLYEPPETDVDEEAPEVCADDLSAMVEKFGPLQKFSVHPNRTHALATFKSQPDATKAFEQLPKHYKARYVSKDNQLVVSKEMIDACWDAEQDANGVGGRRRVREVVTFEQIQSAVVEAEKRAKPLKLPKKPQYDRHHLVNQDALMAIYDAEVAIAVKKWKIENEKPSMDKLASVEDASAVPRSGGQSPMPEELELSSEDVKRREKLLAEGFFHWAFSEFRAFTTAITSGTDRNDYAAIAEAIGTKTADEVREYSHAFFERGPKCIKNFEGILKRVEDAERKKKRAREMHDACMKRVEECDGDPLQELKFSAKTGVQHDAAIDRKLFFSAYQNRFAPGTAAAVGQEIQTTVPHHRFDAFMQTRDKHFFENRLRSLVQSVVQETLGPQEAKKRRKKETPPPKEIVTETSDTTLGDVLGATAPKAVPQE